LWIVRSVLRTRNIQIDYDWFLAAADDYRLYRLVFSSVQLLMRDVGRNVDEVSRAGFIDELEIVSPAKACAATDYVDYGFEFAVMMRTGSCVGMHYDCSSPEFLRADFGMRDGFGTGHARRLRSIAIQFATADDAQAVEFPIGSFIVSSAHYLEPFAV